MCAFTSDFDRGRSGYSPDRVDALVWALTELMVSARNFGHRPGPASAGVCPSDASRPEMGGITHECLAHPLIRLAGHVLEAIQRGYWPSVGWATVLYKLSTKTRKVIEASPFDPAANLAGALCAPSDRRSLGVVSWPEISKQFQKFALILRRTFPRPVPRGVYDHSPTPRSPRQRIAQNRPEIRRAPPIGIGTRAPARRPKGPQQRRTGRSFPLAAKPCCCTPLRAPVRAPDASEGQPDDLGSDRIRQATEGGARPIATRRRARVATTWVTED